MLELDLDLPAGALLNTARADYRARLTGTSAIWFEGEKGAFQADPETGTIATWNTADASRSAVPVEPNEGNGILSAAGGTVGLHCRTGENCGLVAPKVTENAATFTMAVVYLPDEEEPSRTLLTVNTGYSGSDEKGSNYLFLSDGADFFTVKDTRGAVEIIAPVTSKPGQPRLAIVTLTRDSLALAEGLNAPMTMRGADPGMRAAADLFIGCRSHRKGLKKTLGGAVILDVIFWPDHALLLPRTGEDSARYLDLKRYFLWGY